MSQQINDNFQLLAALSLDDRYRQPTIANRDAISTSRRFQGLLSFVEQTQTLYILLGGVANSNWVGIAGPDVSNNIETVIEGFYVLSAGKTTQLDWEVGDKFRGWIGNRYVVGTILSLPVSLPSDIDNTSKVELVVDSEVISDLNTDQVLNNSTVIGTTATDALDYLDDNKANNPTLIVTTADFITTVETDGSIAKITPDNLPFAKLWKIQTLTPTIGGQATRIAFREGESDNRGFPVLIYMHGAAGNQNSPFEDAVSKKLIDQFLQAGYMVATSNAYGDSWGNQNSINAYEALIEHLTTEYVVDKIVIIGHSMGGIVGLNYLDQTTRTIDAFYGIFPATNLRWCYDNGFASAIETAYGFVGSANYATATAGYDPQLKLATDFPKIKYRFVSSPEDLLINEDQNSILFNSKIAANSLINRVVHALGDHGDASHFILDDAISFSDRNYIEYPIAYTHPPGTSTIGVATTKFVTDGLNLKQNTLTNPVTGTGTTNYISKFTGISTLGNSKFFDNGTNIGIGTNTPNITGNLGSNNVTIFNPTFYATLEIFGGTGTQGGNLQFGSGTVRLSSVSSDFISTGNSDLTFRVMKSSSITTAMQLKETGVVNIPNLGGTGTRQVVADASGNLSATATPPDPRPYKVYTALISQTGTSAPTATVLENTLGGTIIWTRTGIGTYVGTLSGVFITNKTAVFFTKTAMGGAQHTSSAYSPTTSTVIIINSSPGGDADIAGDNSAIEIRVYN